MSTNPKARAWVEVRADALRRNYTRIGEAVGPGARILPMVKADAYGLGVASVVECLEPLDPWGFGVAAVQEGLELRRLGVERPVVVCSPAPIGEIDDAVEADLQLSVSSLDTLRRLAEAGRRAGRVAGWHLDVDTGMGRSGFDWRCADDWLPEVGRPDPALRWVGCYTHLHSADEDGVSVEAQWQRLSSVLDRLEEPPEGLMVHVLNSAGVFRAPEHARALVRPGIFLYGGRVGDGQPEPEPVASVRARVVRVREVTAGTTLGYGATHTAGGAERWATLAIGYGDGLPRALSNRGHALLRGVRTAIVGRISMDVTVVDCSGVPDVTEGDVATLIGADGDERITVDDVAGQAGTISYEILTGLTKRLPRVWQ
jgi:alanine racemase